MNKHLSHIFCLFLIVISFSCEQQKEKEVNKLTAINTLSYTGVIYSSSKDTVIISNYAGKIAKKIKDQLSEQVIAHLDDEIYGLAYSSERNEIIATTLHTGIVILNASNGEIVKKLSLGNTWAIRIGLTSDENYLYTTDLSGKNHLWEVHNDYHKMEIAEDKVDKSLRFADELGNFYYASQDSIFQWNDTKQELQHTFFTQGKRLVDVDNEGNLLLLNYNECSLFEKTSDSIVHKVEHPNWIYLNPQGETLAEIPFSMQLTRAKFAGDKFYTGGIDRSIRVWDKKSGTLLDSWTGHKGTISDLQVSKNKQQLVSVDLKGTIKFWDLK